MSALDPSVEEDPGAATAGFSVRLENFEGPFDLLLQLISRHQLDISEVALSRVTDDFLTHMRALDDWDLDGTTGFLVVASTLLDLKVVRLLPKAEVEDEADLALLEARDLLFARLLQYRAFKQAAALMGERMDAETRRFARVARLDERLLQALPEVLISATPQDLADLATAALSRRHEPPGVVLEHLHPTLVSVREQGITLAGRLRKLRGATFRALVADSPDLITTVARFLALLELFRSGSVAFEQLTPMGELTIRWTGTDSGDIELDDEYDAPPPAERSLDTAERSLDTAEESTDE